MMSRRARTGIRAAVLLGAVAVVAYASDRPGLWHEAERASASSWSIHTTKRASSLDGYPLRVGQTRRYLVDRRGRPFLIVGDAPQSLIVNASLRDAKTYLANRAARGFNSVWINLLCNRYTGGRADGTTFDGIAPFTTPGDLSTPNEQYFRRADAIVRMADRYGITVFLDPIETGGWLDVLRENGLRKDVGYGRWIGDRYRSFPNIVWFNGNDFQQWRVKANDAVALAVARGIRETDARHIQTVELDAKTSGSRDDPSWTPVIALDAAYTYYPTYAQVLKEYTRPDFAPTFLVEANYEFEDARPRTLRRQEYWSLLSGAAGQLYGNRYTWQFGPTRLVGNKYGWRATFGWRNTLDSKGVTELEYVTKLFASRRWFELVPDNDHRLVTSGIGTFATRGQVDDSDYATAARTPDGKLGIVYLPTRRLVSVDLRRLGPEVDAKWYDPTSGQFIPVGGSPFRNTAKWDFTPPGANAGGDDDWVLVLTAA
jgi:hypothetical protein